MGLRMLIKANISLNKLNKALISLNRCLIRPNLARNHAIQKKLTSPVIFFVFAIKIVSFKSRPCLYTSSEFKTYDLDEYVITSL